MSILQSGNTYTVKNLTGTYEKLPVGNYILKFDPTTGKYYLNQKETFKLPNKIYGDHSIIERWLYSWRVNSSKNLGILLTGIKGSGKTITAQKFCVEANLPVIIINETAYGSEFIDFLTSPELGECIVFIDEFEKIYNRHDERQYDLLSLMDGNYSTKLIFLLTVNEEHINEYLINRLNRIKYRKAYRDLEPAVIEEVIEDLLENKEHKDSIYEFFERVNICTFDLLTNLIKEMNLFKEDAITCGFHLNLRGEEKRYGVFEIRNGVEHPCHFVYWAPTSTTMEISRKTLDYLWAEEPKLDGDSLKDLSASNVEKSWSVLLEIEECVLTSTDGIVRIKHIASGLEFKLVEQKQKYSLVF